MTSCDSDYQLALSLQQQFMEDDFNTNASSSTASSSKQGPTNIVDPQWELIDPNPNVFALFQEFNKQFFWKRLDMVEVRWSPRMTLCAGICSYQGHGGLCSIGLSQPLLKLRPRKDLVETLLHEMIHAYLFVTANNRDRDGHGPEFCKHMNRINAEAGTKITIYHSFHDEVNELRQHWWRCRGVCRNRPPYFGFVKRSMNRAPSKNDTWWAQHQQTCGGEYDKIKEPENYGKNKSKAKTNKENKIDPNQSVLNFKSVKNPSLNTPSTSVLKTPTVENIKKKSPKKIQNAENKFPNSSNHILGGAKLKENPRGIPLNSRLVKLFQKPSPKKTLNTSQTGKKLADSATSRIGRLCRDMRLNGDASVNFGASAFRKLKVVTKFQKSGKLAKLMFESDDELDKIVVKPTKQPQFPVVKLEPKSNGIKRKSDEIHPNVQPKKKKLPSFIFLDVSSESDCSDDDISAFTVKNEPLSSDEDLPSWKSQQFNKNTTGSLAKKIKLMEPVKSADVKPVTALKPKVSPIKTETTKTTSSDSDDDLPPFYSPDQNLPCPICGERFSPIKINSHVDQCLNMQTLREMTS